MASSSKINSSNDLGKKIADLLLCQHCNNYLYIPVMIHTEDNKIICGRCYEKFSVLDLKEDTYITKIGELLQFPCYYHTHGCRELCTWKEAKSHEEACPFRQYKCPAAEQTNCKFNGSPANLRAHYLSCHNMLSASMQLKLQDEVKNYLVEDLGELFVFQTECDMNEDMLWYDVRFLGPPQRAARFHFKVELYIDNEERKYVERKQVESDETWKMNKAESLAIRIAMLKAMLKNSDDIRLKLKIDVRKPLYNGQTDEALMHEVECPVCKDHMIRPIRMCAAGHNICDNCFQKLTECPTCRGVLGQTRNISLETLSEQMHYRCMYYDEGCPYTDIPDNIKDHEMECEVSYYDCPLKQLVSCKWRGKVGHVCIHASKEHQFKF
ncbi:seven in absentia [Carabus blaptoides fortunei]